jgi:hypothetical protein
VGGLMASLDPFHLGLVLAVLRHAGCGSGSIRISRQTSQPSTCDDPDRRQQ